MCVFAPMCMCVCVCVHPRFVSDIHTQMKKKKEETKNTKRHELSNERSHSLLISCVLRTEQVVTQFFFGVLVCTACVCAPSVGSQEGGVGDYTDTHTQNQC